MRNWILLLTVAIVPAASSAPVRAEETRAAPTTAPADGATAALIRQLGDPDFRVRRDASARLRGMGKSAADALAAAQNDPNAEVRLRAGQLLRMLQTHPVPGRPAHHSHTSSVTVSMVNGRRTLDIDDGGRQIRIVEGDGDIEMQVTGEREGRPVTERFTARSPESLHDSNPEAFALYKRWSSSVGSDVDDVLNMQAQQGRVGAIQIQPQIPGIAAAVSDDLDGLRDRLDRQMKDAHLTEDQQKQVTDALDAVEIARAPAIDDPKGQDQSIHRYDAACDALRKTLSDLHLPDPGDALPPPQSARLGISAPGLSEDGGILISHVVPDSRADRLGLQEDDIIRKVNGKPVRDVKELRRIVTEHPKGLQFEVTRDGHDLKLNEK